MSIEATTPAVKIPEPRAWRAFADRRVWSRLAYLLATGPIGWFWLTAIVMLVFVGVGLSIVWVGVLVLWLMFFIIRGGARLDRWLIRRALGYQIEDPYRPDASGSWVRRWKVRLTDPATWRDLVYLGLVLPILGTIWFVSLVFILAIPLHFLSLPVTYRWFPDQRSTPLDFNGGEWLVIDSLPDALFAAFAGVVLLGLLPIIVRGMATAHGTIAGSLLAATRRSTLDAEITGLRTSRDHGLDAAEAERRRIERDLHDGAQQRLVALAMGLGMAKEKLDTDPAMAKELVDEAHGHAKVALVELRDLARGIHPTVLTDRGLDAALSALAAQAPFPVDVSCPAGERYSTRVESTAYFVVAECLANAAKHSDASRARVNVHRTGTSVVVSVEDDGVGGADPTGTGLDGLRHRVTSVEGTFNVSSPPGGPTSIVAELPCE